MTANRGAITVLNKFEEIQNLSKTSVEATTTAFQTLSKTAQTITTEIADYSKRSFENSAKAMQSLIAVKSPEKAIEVQTDYVKAAYEDFTAEVTKLGVLYADLAKEVFKPYENLVGKSIFVNSR
jgi:hypothetical protein